MKQKHIHFFVFRSATDKTNTASSKSNSDSSKSKSDENDPKTDLNKNKDKSKKLKVKKNLVSINNASQPSKQAKKRKLNTSKEHKVVKKIKKTSA